MTLEGTSQGHIQKQVSEAVKQISRTGVDSCRVTHGVQVYLVVFYSAHGWRIVRAVSDALVAPFYLVRSFIQSRHLLNVILSISWKWSRHLESTFSHWRWCKCSWLVRPKSHAAQHLQSYANISGTLTVWVENSKRVLDSETTGGYAQWCNWS